MTDQLSFRYYPHRDGAQMLCVARGGREIALTELTDAELQVALEIVTGWYGDALWSASERHLREQMIAERNRRMNVVDMNAGGGSSRESMRLHREWRARCGRAEGGI